MPYSNWKGRLDDLELSSNGTYMPLKHLIGLCPIRNSECSASELKRAGENLRRIISGGYLVDNIDPGYGYIRESDRPIIPSYSTRFPDEVIYVNIRYGCVAEAIEHLISFLEFEGKKKDYSATTDRDSYAGSRRAEFVTIYHRLMKLLQRPPDKAAAADGLYNRQSFEDYYGLVWRETEPTSTNQHQYADDLLGVFD